MESIVQTRMNLKLTKMQKILNIFLYFFCINCCLLFLSACKEESEPIVFQEGWQPVYKSYEELKDIHASSPKVLRTPGKIYYKDSYLFINERFEGVHVINNEDPENPIKESFINIPGNLDIAIKGNILYADNGPDLIAIDINDLSNVEVVARTIDAYGTYNQLYPAFAEGFFECVDTTKGIVVNWIRAELPNPQCQR